MCAYSRQHSVKSYMKVNPAFEFSKGKSKICIFNIMA